MGLVVAAERFDSSDLTATTPTFFHRFTPDKLIELKAIHLWVVKFGTPTLTDLQVELRSRYDATNGGRALISTSSNSYDIADVSSANYALRQIYFDWDSPCLLRAGEEYTLNLKATTYVGDNDNHLAWVRSWPDPIVPFTESGDIELLNRFPFLVGLIARTERR